MKHCYPVLFTLLLGALGVPWAAGAAGEAPIHSYTSTNLGSLGGHATEAEAIDDAGHVVGTSRNSNGYYRAFRWRMA